MIMTTSGSGSGDEDDDGAAARKKLLLSKDQAAVLEECFKTHHTLTPKQKVALASSLGLWPRQVEVWFQNRRARTKLKQTEVDCEYLAEENRRLGKEVAELRALSAAPAAAPLTTLTMCLSCRRVASSSSPPSSSNNTSSLPNIPAAHTHAHAAAAAAANGGSMASPAAAAFSHARTRTRTSAFSQLADQPAPASSSLTASGGGYAELPELVMYSPFGTGTRIYCFSEGRYGMIMTTIGDGNNTGGHSLGNSNLLQELVAAAPPHVFFTRSSGGPRGRSGRSGSAAAEFYRRWLRDYDLEAQRHLDYDLEAAGGRPPRAAVVAAAVDGAGRAAAPVQEPSEVAKMLDGVMVQAYAAFLPMCVTAYPVLKDAPDHVKFTIFGGLALITVGLFVGILSRSVARRGLAIRLVSFSAIAVLTFSVASQLSSRTYIALTALVGVALNLIIMLLPL